MWKVEQNPHANYPDRVTITFPGGFKFDLINPLYDGLTMLAELVRKGSMITLPDGQILYMDADGGLNVFDVDPWINSGFTYQQSVGNATGLAFVLANFLKGEHVDE